MASELSRLSTLNVPRFVLMTIIMLLVLSQSGHLLRNSGSAQCDAAQLNHSRTAREEGHTFFDLYDEPRDSVNNVNRNCLFNPTLAGNAARQWFNTPYKPKTVITSGVSIVQIYYGAEWRADKMNIINNFVSNIIVSDYFTTVSRSIFDHDSIYATSSMVIGGTVVVNPTETSFKNSITTESQWLNLISVAVPKLSKQTQSVSLNQTIYLIYIGIEVSVSTEFIRKYVLSVCGYHGYAGGSLFAAIIEPAQDLTYDRVGWSGKIPKTRTRLKECMPFPLPPTIKPDDLIGPWSMTSTIAHEIAEIISDPFGAAGVALEWFGQVEISANNDPANGGATENADKCNDCYGTECTREVPSGSHWNMALGDYKYLVQEIYDPRSGLCALRGLKPPYASDTICNVPKAAHCKFSSLDRDDVVNGCEFYAGPNSVCERISPTTLVGRCKCKPDYCHSPNRGCISPFPSFPTSCPWYVSAFVTVTGSVPSATAGRPVPIGTKLTVAPLCNFPGNIPISNIPEVVSNTITCMPNGLWNFNPVCTGSQVPKSGNSFTKTGVRRIELPPGTTVVAVRASSARQPATHCIRAPHDNPIHETLESGVPNGKVDVVACRNATVGMHCILECNQGYRKTNDFICGSNGLWSTAHCAACPFAQILGATALHSTINGFYAYVGTYNDSPLFQSIESTHNSALKNIFIYKAGANGLWHIGNYRVGSTSNYIYRAHLGAGAQDAAGPFNTENAAITWIETLSGALNDNLVVHCACGAMHVTMDAFNIRGTFVADHAAVRGGADVTNTGSAGHSVFKLIEIHTLSHERQSSCLMCHQYTFQLFRDDHSFWVLNVTDIDAGQTHFATLLHGSSAFPSEELLPFNSTWEVVSFLAGSVQSQKSFLQITSTSICESVCKAEPPFPDGGYVRVRPDGHTCGTQTMQGIQCTATCLSPRGSTPSGFLTCRGGSWNYDDNVTCVARCAAAPPTVLFGAPASGCEGTAHGGVCPLICSPGLYKSSDFICNDGDWEINSTACVSCPLLQISGVTTDKVVNGFYSYNGLDSMGIPYYVSKNNNLAIVSNELGREWFIQEYNDEPAVFFIANYSGQMLPYNVAKDAWRATGIYSDDDMIVACACPTVSLTDSKKITGFSGDFFNVLANETTGEFVYINTQQDVHPRYIVSSKVKDVIGMYMLLLVDDLKTTSVDQSYAFTNATEKYLLSPSIQAGNLTWLVRNHIQGINSVVDYNNNNNTGFSPYLFLKISNRCNLIETCLPPQLPNNALVTLNWTTYPSGGKYPLNCSWPKAPSSMFLTCTDGSWDVQSCDDPCSLAAATNNTNFMGSGGFVNASLCKQAFDSDGWSSNVTKTSGTICPLQCSPGSFPSGEFICRNGVWETSNCLNFCPILILHPGNTARLDLPHYYPNGSASVFTFLEFGGTENLPIFESDTRKFLYAVNDSTLGIYWAVSDVKEYAIDVGIILRSTPHIENYPATPFEVPPGTWQIRQTNDGLAWVTDASVSVAQGSCTAGNQPTEISCPVNSHGQSVQDGCTCNKGFYGHVTAISRPPFYHSSCEAVGCPEGTHEAQNGCQCEAGYSGSVLPLSIAPYYNITCKLADCPVNSYRKPDETDCACEKGFEGYVTASNTPPYFNSTCTSVPCPANSHGVSVSHGCTCNTGFTGSVTAIHSLPYFTISDDDYAAETLASLIENATYDAESDTYLFSDQFASPAFESTCAVAYSSIFDSISTSSVTDQQLLILLVCVLGSVLVVSVVLIIVVQHRRNKASIAATSHSGGAGGSESVLVDSLSAPMPARQLEKPQPEGGGYVEVAVFSESNLNSAECDAVDIE